MAKYYGTVGYAETSMIRPGVVAEMFVERKYYGDVIRNVRRLEHGSSINDDVVVNNQISIVADAYAYEHFFAIRYAEWMGVNWKVTNVEVQRPRLLLTIGDVYNGQMESD